MSERLHLMFRTGFAVDDQEAEAASRAKSYDALVDEVVTLARSAKAPAPPTWVKAESDLDLDRASRRDRAVELKGWWARTMLDSAAPLRERMTLFWHNHFTSSLRKVKWPTLMLRQNQTLRAHALGSFAELLHAMIRDPSLLFYLDNQRSVALEPNENLARELMELFTLGEGNYGESDVKEAARALTGYAINRASGTFHFRRRHHDKGIKVILGKQGAFSGDDLVDLLLARDETARFIVRKLWREFIDDQPLEASVRAWARSFKRDYDIAKLVGTMLKSQTFRRHAGRGTLVKSPVTLVIGAMRTTRVDLPERIVLRSLKQQGQDIMDPPNVAGWPGGRRWINTATLAARQRFVRRVARASLRLDDLGELRLATPPVRGRVGLSALTDPAYQVT